MTKIFEANKSLMNYNLIHKNVYNFQIRISCERIYFNLLNLLYNYKMNSKFNINMK